MTRNSLLAGVRSMSARGGRIGIGFADERESLSADCKTSVGLMRFRGHAPTGFKLLRHRKHGGAALACGKLDDETLEEYEVLTREEQSHK